MNNYETMKARSDNARILKMGYKRNCVRLNTGNTNGHELQKFWQAWELQKAGHDYVTEAEFQAGGRADLYDLDTGTIIEILASETELQALVKCCRYPYNHRIELYRADGHFIGALSDDRKTIRRPPGEHHAQQPTTETGE